MKPIVCIVIALAFVIIAAFILARRESIEERDQKEYDENKAKSTIYAY